MASAGHHLGVPQAVRILAFALGVAVVVLTAVSVFMTLVVPRVSAARLQRGVAGALARAVLALAPRGATYQTRDRFMAIVGPLTLMVLFVAWLVLLVLGYGLMLWWATGTSLAQALAVSGSSVFTLGVATVALPGSDVLEFAAAGTGLLVVALEIAYLPALYNAFSARETEVTLLAQRAGTPAWGPEVIARHHWFKNMGELPDLYRTWERWAASVAETHANYPTLMWFRSPLHLRSWLTGLTAMMDAAALHDAASPSDAPRQARVFLMMAVGCLRSLSDSLHIGYPTDPHPSDPVRLTEAEFRQGLDRLEAVGFEFERSAEETWTNFRGWRVNYESMVDAITDRIMPPPAPWFPRRPELGAVQFPHVVDRTPENPEGDRPLERGRTRLPPHSRPALPDEGMGG